MCVYLRTCMYVHVCVPVCVIVWVTDVCVISDVLAGCMQASDLFCNAQSEPCGELACNASEK
jgi:hypothetical protein